MIVKQYDRLKERVLEHTLSNGLLCRVIPKPGFAKSYAFLAVDYGSMDTDYVLNGIRYASPQGVAHYLEHKMFDMPDGNVMQQFSQYGGSPNAFTSYDITAYYVECTDHFAENLRILLRYVSTPYFTAQSVEKEQGIIAQEIRMYEDSPDSCVFENLFSAVFAHHPVRNSIAGTVESIAQITDQTLYDCYHAFYTPANMMLCVVGDVDAELVFRMAEELTPAGCKQKPPVRNYGPDETMQPAQTRILRKMEVSMPMFALGFKTEPAAHGPDSMVQEIVGDLAAEILMGESSSLYTSLYEQNLIDSGFSCGYEGLKGVSLLTASGDSNDPEAVAQAILAEADRIRSSGVDTVLFERLKKSALGRRMRNLDSFESICYRVCAYEFEGVDYFSFPECFQRVDQQAVAEFLSRTVCSERMALSVIEPKQ